MVRLTSVDDHQIVRAGLREMLANELGIRIQFEAASGAEALKLLREHPCDVLLLDLALPGRSGIDVLRSVRPRYESLKVLVFSVFSEERYALPTIRNGAGGYLCKDCERRGTAQGNSERRAGPALRFRQDGRVAGRQPGRRSNGGGA